MDGNGTWIKLYRKLTEWEWYKRQSVKALFIHLLLSATWKPHKQLVGDVVAELQPGQVPFGRRAAARETGLGEQEVRTALLVLEQSGAVKVTHHPTHRFSIITICNWQTYQAQNDDTNPLTNPPLTHCQPAANPPLTTNKNGKNDKNGKNQDPQAPKGGRRCRVEYTPEFEAFWKLYPRGEAKGYAFKVWQRTEGIPDTATLEKVIAKQRLSAQWQKDSGQFIPHPATWLNGRRWEDKNGESRPLFAPQSPEANEAAKYNAYLPHYSAKPGESRQAYIARCEVAEAQKKAGAPCPS